MIITKVNTDKSCNLYQLQYINAWGELTNAKSQTFEEFDHVKRSDMFDLMLAIFGANKFASWGGLNLVLKFVLEGEDDLAQLQIRLDEYEDLS